MAPSIGIHVGSYHRIVTAGPILWTVDFTALAPGAVDLSATGAVLTRASSATVQTSSSTVVTAGIGNDVARVGSNGTALGLVLEETRTNFIARARDATSVAWQPGGSAPQTRPYGVGPDGDATTPTRHQISSAGSSRYYACSGMGTTTAIHSCWIRRPLTTGAIQVAGTGAGTGTNCFYGTTSAGTTWQRVSAREGPIAGAFNASSGNANDATTRGGIAAQALDQVTDLHQAESGLHPTEVIITAGATGTRAGERLYYATGSSLINNGRLGLGYSIHPKGTSSQYLANMRLWTIDASNYCEVDFSTRKIVTVIGGVSYTTASAMTWAASDQVDIWVEAGGGTLNTVAKYRVNEGSTTTLGTSGAAQGTIAASGAVDLLCNGTANQFNAWVRTLAAYRDTQRPAWAA